MMIKNCIDTFEMKTVTAPLNWGTWLKSGYKLAANDTMDLIKIVMIWMERNRNRRTLKELDDHLLMDVGLSRAELETEIQKPFWKA